LNWNPELRSPLTEPGVDVKKGEYLIAVRGQDLRPPTNIYSLFENTSGKIIEITVGPTPTAPARALCKCPDCQRGALRNRDWVEGNLKKVDEATGGRVAYVYVPNTAGAGHDYFKRYFFPAVVQRGDYRRRTLQTPAARTLTITSTCCAGRWAPIGRCAMAQT